LSVLTTLSWAFLRSPSASAVTSWLSPIVAEAKADDITVVWAPAVVNALELVVVASVDVGVVGGLVAVDGAVLGTLYLCISLFNNVAGVVNDV